LNVYIVCIHIASMDLFGQMSTLRSEIRYINITLLPLDYSSNVVHDGEPNKGHQNDLVFFILTKNKTVIILIRVDTSL